MEVIRLDDEYLIVLTSTCLVFPSIGRATTTSGYLQIAASSPLGYSWWSGLNRGATMHQDRIRITIYKADGTVVTKTIIPEKPFVLDKPRPATPKN
jgi:hypothetical protein